MLIKQPAKLSFRQLLNLFFGGRLVLWPTAIGLLGYIGAKQQKNALTMHKSQHPVSISSMPLSSSATMIQSFQ
jgi:hypothetical protein